MVLITNASINAEIQRQQGLTSDIANYQTQISSGVKYTDPSDNPQDWIQISSVGKQQSQVTTWQSNLTYAQSRATQASASLDDINQLKTDVTSKLIQATSQGVGTPGSEAIAVALQGTLDSIKAIMNTTDYQGIPTFDNGTSTTIPVGQGLNYEAVGTQQDIENGIVTTPASGSTPAVTKSIYDILTAAIAAVRSGSSDAITTSIGEVKAASDHIILENTQQGVRSNRLTDQVQRLTTASLQLTERRSGLEDTDLTEVITKLQAKMVSLQAAQAAFAKINQQSLFDLLK